MKKIVLLITLSFAISCFYGQGYFEKKGKKIEPMDLAAQMTEGPSKYDYSRFITDSKLVLNIDEYHPKSLYNNYDLNKKFKKIPVEKRNETYNELWLKAFEESSLKQLVNIEIASKDVSTLSNEEKQQSLFLSYKEYFGLGYVLLWYFDEANQERILTMVYINDYDFVNKNDLRLMLNFIYIALTPNTDKAIEKMHEEMNAAITTDEKGTKRKKSLGTVFSTEESQDNISEYTERYTAAFLERSGSYTLLIPEEYKEKEKDIEEVLKKWKHSDYKIVPSSEIEEIRDRMDTSFVYLRIQSSQFFHIAYLITGEDKVIHSYNFLRSPLASLQGNKKPTLLEGLIIDLEEKETRLINKSGSMRYHKLTFKQKTLPTDLSTSKIVFVRMKEHEHKRFKLYNEYFEKQMEKYPYKYEVVDDLPTDYDYRIFIKRTVAPLKITTSSSSKPIRSGVSFDIKKEEVNYSTIENFYVYLENKKTKELYKTPDKIIEGDEVIFKSSDLFIKGVRNFVYEAKKLNKN